MTMTRPCRRITRHLLQIRLTLGLTFTVLFPYRPGGSRRPACMVFQRLAEREAAACLDRSLVAVDDPPAAQVVGRKLHNDPVLGQDPNVVLAHLATDVCQ